MFYLPDLYDISNCLLFYVEKHILNIKWPVYQDIVKFKILQFCSIKIINPTKMRINY